MILISQTNPDTSYVARGLQDLLVVNLDILLDSIKLATFPKPQRFRVTKNLFEEVTLAEITLLVNFKVNSPSTAEYFKEMILKDENPSLEGLSQAIANVVQEILSYYQKSEIKRFWISRTIAIQQKMFPFIKILRPEVNVYTTINIKNDIGFVGENFTDEKRLRKLEEDIQKIDFQFERDTGYPPEQVELFRREIMALKTQLAPQIIARLGKDGSGFLSGNIVQFMNEFKISPEWIDSIFDYYDENNEKYQITADRLADILIEKGTSLTLDLLIKEFNLKHSLPNVDWLESLKLIKKQRVASKLSESKLEKKIVKESTKISKDILVKIWNYSKKIKPVVDERKRGIFG